MSFQWLQCAYSFRNLRKGLERREGVVLSKHFNRDYKYDPRSGFPYYNRTTPTNCEGIPYPPPVFELWELISMHAKQFVSKKHRGWTRRTLSDSEWERVSSYGSWIYNYLCNQCLSPQRCEFETRSLRSVLDTLCDKGCQWLVTCRWFSPVSSTNKTDRNDITEILLKVALGTITLTIAPYSSSVRLYMYTNEEICYHGVWVHIYQCITTF